MDSLKPESNVKRQATFETEPADTVVGRSIRRGDINLPYIDANAVKNGDPEPRDKDAIKKEQLKGLKEKGQKEKELRALKDKKEKELKALKEKELKNKKEQLQKVNNDNSSKDPVQNSQKGAVKGKDPPKNAKDTKAEKEKESKTKKDKELKEQQEKAAKLKEEKEKLLKAKNEQANQRNDKNRESTIQNNNKINTKSKEENPKEKIGFLQKLTRSLSPSKNKQTPPVDTNDPLPQSKVVNGKGGKSVPNVLVVDQDRFAEVRVATPTSKTTGRGDENTHFKARKQTDNDSMKSDTERVSLGSQNDSETVERRARPRVVASKMDAWMNEKRGSQSSVDSQKLKALRKLNTNSPRTSLPDDDSVPVGKENLPSKPGIPRVPGMEASSLESDTESIREPYDHVLAERDCLLTAEIAYKRRIQQLEHETNQLAEVLDKRDNEIKELKWNIENPSSVSEVTAMTQKLQEEVDKLKNEIDELKKEKKKYKILHQDSERKVTEVVQENDGLREKVILLEENKIPQVEEIQKENRKLESSIKHLKTKLQETEEQFDFLKNENIDLNGEVRARRNEVQELLITLKNQKTSELELQKAHNKLEDRVKKFEGLEKELADAVAKTAILEAEKEHVQALMKENEKEVKAIKDQLDAKESEVDNQNLAIELQKQEIDNLKEDVERQKKELEKIEELNKEILSLKGNIKSLQSQLDEAQRKNETLSEEVEEGKGKISRIQEHVQTAAGTNETLRKTKKDLEAAKKEKLRIEEELETSRSEISKLQQQNMELNIKIGNLNDRLKFLEDTNQKNFNRSRNAVKNGDVDDKLSEENKRLKLKLVEKNFNELTSDDEKKALSSRLENLERKQIDNDVKVQQLQGWVDEIYSDPSSHVPSPSGNPPQKAIPRVAVAAQSDKGPSNKTRKTKGKKTREVSSVNTVLSKQVDPRVTVSLGDIRVEKNPSRSSTPSLPIIEDIPEQVPLYNSYFYIYKQKQKLLRQQQKIR